MEYRVEALAAAAETYVDTLRFYQSRGLLPPPQKKGRIVLYGEEHLERVRRIRGLQRQGFTLAQIERLLTPPEEAATPESHLAALAEQQAGGPCGRTLSRAELAAEAGVPEVLVQAVQAAGLIESFEVDGEERFSEADLEMARAGLAVLGAGFPLNALLEHALVHAGHVQQVCDGAIDLFDEHVRKRGDGADSEAVTAAFLTLLPQITRLVALHFQRTLVNRALNRLRGRGEQDALAAALAATESARLDVEVTWR